MYFKQIYRHTACVHLCRISNVHCVSCTITVVRTLGQSFTVCSVARYMWWGTINSTLSNRQLRVIFVHISWWMWHRRSSVCGADLNLNFFLVYLPWFWSKSTPFLLHWSDQIPLAVDTPWAPHCTSARCCCSCSSLGSTTPRVSGSSTLFFLPTPKSTQRAATALRRSSSVSTVRLGLGTNKGVPRSLGGVRGFEADALKNSNGYLSHDHWYKYSKITVKWRLFFSLPKTDEFGINWEVFFFIYRNVPDHL